MTDFYVAFFHILDVRSSVRAAEDVSLHKRLVSALEAARDTSRFRGEKRNFTSGEEHRWSPYGPEA